MTGLLLVALLAGCERDLEVPDGPQRGSLKGSVDTGGNIPLGGNKVIAVSERGAPVEQTTQADGTFVFGDLPPGLYALEVNLPGFAPLVKANVRVKIGEETDAGALRPSWLAGTASEATLLGKVTAGGGGDVNGAQVEFQLQAASQTIAKTTVGADGTFVQRLPPGVYTLKALHPNYTVATAADVALADGERKDISSTPLVMDVNPATLSGTVMREVDRASPVAAGNVTVTLGNGQTTTSDPTTGVFNFTGLAAGTQTIRFALSNHHDAVATRTVELKPGQATAYPAVTLLQDRGSLTGTVIMSDGKPVAGVSVTVTGTPYAATVTPLAAEPDKGRFFIADIPIGTYEVVASSTLLDGPAYPPNVKAAQTVTAGVTTTVPDMTLSPMLGDLAIDDGDPSNAAGYTRTEAVTLQLTNLTSPVSYRASEDPTFANAATFSPLSGTSVSFTLSSAQGKKTVYFQYRDASGTTSRTLTASTILDNVAPTSAAVVIEADAPFTNKSAALTLTLTAVDPQTGTTEISGLGSVRINENGAATGGLLTATPQPYAQTLAYTRTASGDGSQAVHVQFFDRAGNSSSIVTDSIVIDTAAPTGTLSIRRGALATVDGFTHTTAIRIDQTAAMEPNGGYLRIRRANSSAELSTKAYGTFSAVADDFLEAGADGVRTVYAQLIDAAGNTSQVFSGTITYDTTVPSPVSATSPRYSKTQSITVTVSATDDRQMSPTAAVTVSESGAFTAAGTVGPLALPSNSQVTFPLSSGEGEKVVHVRFRDAAGNDSQTSFLVKLDATAPALNSFRIAGPLADGAVSFSVSSSQNVTLELDQVGAVEFFASNTLLSSCPASGYTQLTTTSIPHALGGTGAQTVWLCLRDDAANTVGPVAANISVDTVSPTGCQLALTGARSDGAGTVPPGKTGVGGVTQAFAGCVEQPTEVVFTEAATGCAATASLPWVPYSTSLIVNLTSGDGSKTVRGCVRDAARNTSSFAPATIVLDTRGPTNAALLLNGGEPYVNSDGVTANGYTVDVNGSADDAVTWAFSDVKPITSTFVTVAADTFTFSSSPGVRTLHAWFKDDVGNVSEVVSDSIEFDVAEPSTVGATLTISTPTAGFTNSRTVLVMLAGVSPSDVPEVELVQAVNPAACAASDFTGAVSVPRFSQTGFVFTPGDGPKRLCLRLRDAAGNVTSTILTTSITLDTTPPSTPLIVTSPAVLPLAAGTTFTVNTAGAVSESNFLQYEISNDPDPWTVASSSISTTAFTFTVKNNLAATGQRNVMRIRAVDQAGNVGNFGSLVITADTVAPIAPVVFSAGGIPWIDNRDGRSRFYWMPSTSTDIAEYQVRYGASPDTYDGAFAYEGQSPIRVGATTTTFALSGLDNLVTTHVRIAAVDLAGNIGVGGPGTVGELRLEPGFVSPSPLGNTGTLTEDVQRMWAHEDVLYVLATTGNTCGSSQKNIHVRTLDLSQIASPLRAGTTGTPVVPPLLGQYDFGGALGLDCSQWNGDIEMVIQDHWGFMGFSTATTHGITLFDVSNPAALSAKGSIEVGFPVHNVVVRGHRLFAYGRPNRVFAIDISKLYDQDPLTLPDATDIIGTATNALATTSSLALSRKSLMQFDSSAANVVTYKLPDALDSDGTTVWDSTDLVGSVQTLGGSVSGNGSLVSGNYLYVFSRTLMRVFSLNSIWGQTTALGTTHIKYAHPDGRTGGRGANVLGQEIFTHDDNVLRWRFHEVSDLSGSSLPTLSLNRSFTSSSANTTYGPYFFGTTPNNGIIHVYESQRPDSLRLRSRTPGFATPGGSMSGGFYYGIGAVFDLQAGSAPVLKDSTTTFSPFTNQLCAYDQARFDDHAVMLRGPVIDVLSMEPGVERTGGSWPNNLFFGPNYVPSGVTANVAVEAYGNFSIVVETKSDGSYLEVLDMNRVRNPGTSLPGLTAADSRGQYKFTNDTGRASLAMKNGRAFIGLTGTSGPKFYAVNLSNMLDDDNTTVMEAFDAVGQSTVHGPVNVQSGGTNPDPWAIRNIVVRGNYAYLAAPTGLTIVDVSPVLDSSPTTMLPTGSTLVATLATTTQGGSGTGVNGLAVYGSYAFLTLSATNGSNPPSDLLTVDISNPVAPKLIARAPSQNPRRTCQPSAGSPVVEMRDSVAVHGSRAYVGHGYELYIYDLE